MATLFIRLVWNFCKVGNSPSGVQKLRELQETGQKMHVNFDCNVVGVMPVGFRPRQQCMNADMLDKVIVSGIDAHVGQYMRAHNIHI